MTVEEVDPGARDGELQAAAGADDLASGWTAPRRAPHPDHPRMAVYTDITDEELDAFLAEFDLGAPLAFKGIAEGV